MLLMCLLAGALGQSVVAWSAAWGPRPYQPDAKHVSCSQYVPELREVRSGDRVLEGSEADLGAVALHDESVSIWGKETASGLHSIEAFEERGWLVSWRLVRASRCEPNDRFTFYDRTILKAGFPFRSFFASIEDNGYLCAGVEQDSGWSPAVMVKVDVRQGRLWQRADCGVGLMGLESEFHAVPLGIRPTAFAANTAIYSAPLFLLAWASGFVARRLRRPGACAHCGYDVRGLSMCPECGTPVTPASSPPSSAAAP